jgi:hypothetical protein
MCAADTSLMLSAAPARDSMIQTKVYYISGLCMSADTPEFDIDNPAEPK